MSCVYSGRDAPYCQRETLCGLSSTGSALGDLNGVAVEAVIISEAAIR